MTTKEIDVLVHIAYKYDEQLVSNEQTAQYAAINLAINPNFGTIMNKTKLLGVTSEIVDNKSFN